MNTNLKKALIALGSVSALLAVFLIGKCSNGNQPPQTKPLTADEVRAIIDSNFARRDGTAQVITSDEVIKMLPELISKATPAQKEMLLRLSQVEESLRSQGLKMTRFEEFQSSTSRTWSSVMVKLDSITRLRLNLPESATAVSTFDDEWMNAIIWMDGDEVHPSVTMRNVFDLIQYRGKDGKYYARVDNLNPYTTSEAGTSVFELELPNPLPERKGGKWKLGFSVGGGAVINGGGGPASPMLTGSLIFVRQ